MTRKQALTDILVNVVAGRTPKAHEITTAFREWYRGDEPIVMYVRLACDATDILALIDQMRERGFTKARTTRRGFMRTLAFVSSESKKPPKGRLLGAACNLTFYGSGHRDARHAHGITGRRQFPV
jgi:hypothetical protein